MPNTLQSAGKFLAKATALKAGLTLPKPRNLKRQGFSLKTLAAAGIGYMAYKVFSKK